MFPFRRGLLLLTVAAAPVAGAAPNDLMSSGDAPAAAWGVVPLGLLAAGGAVLALGAWRRARRAGPAADAADPCDAEECVRRATVHIEAERFGPALTWMERAAAQAPTSARVQATRGFLLERLGRPAEALDAYDRAASLAPLVGEHDVEAARVAVLELADLERGAALVARALHRCPELVADVEADACFDALEGRKVFDRAVELAWRRYAGVLSGE